MDSRAGIHGKAEWERVVTQCLTPRSTAEWLGVISGIFRDGGEEEPPVSQRDGRLDGFAVGLVVIPGVFHVLEPWSRRAGAMQTQPRVLFSSLRTNIDVFWGPAWPMAALPPPCRSQ